MGREGERETSGALMKYNNALPPTWPSPAARSFMAGDRMFVPAPLQRQKHPTPNHASSLHFTLWACICVLSTCPSECSFHQNMLMCNKQNLQVSLCLKASAPGCCLWNLQLCQRDTTPISHLFKLFFTFHMHTVRVSGVSSAWHGCEMPGQFSYHMCSGAAVFLACKELVLCVMQCVWLEENKHLWQIT